MRLPLVRPQGQMCSFSTYDLPREVFNNAQDGRWLRSQLSATSVGVIVLAVAVVLHCNYPAINFYVSRLVSDAPKQLREDVAYRAGERESQGQLARDREAQDATENLLRNIREQWRQLRAAREAAELTATEIEREEARRQLAAERTGIEVKQPAVPEIRAHASRVEPANQDQQALLTTERKVRKTTERDSQEVKRAREKTAPKNKRKKKN
jgi:hypothetical protein